MRQYYDGVAIEVDDDLPLHDPWLRHRRRLLAELEALTDEQWKARTRCDAWDARGVVSHLITVDGFQSMCIGAAAARTPPTTFIRGFDPATGTDALVAPMLDLAPDVLLGQLVATTESFIATVDALEGDDWDAPGEAPFGHLPARLLLAHSFWDSWLHERDILRPLGLAPAVEPDELLAATWYSLVVGALQGGLLADPDPVGPGPETPIEVTLRFEDLPEDPLELRIDTGVRVARANGDHAVPAGSAVELVEHFTGREPAGTLKALPPDFSSQLERAALIL
jgi:hypothetical protein